ncbi:MULTISPECIES: N-acetylmuramoyl-L-alanine amidase CwlD [Clostridium]|uniref:N-acetylmuramoyl-L-alanine amidase CwlD n=1 Tax=Clostridium botulinum TaxID=1491 RepID=A0AAU8YYX5_CLOBO|nr:N-acetylmuramoyl-L-alanine amidase CwlD [Clostridium sporogenes]AVP64359.1 N-acetylmuramoyl-L-alanine amidase CwlD [Clostridium botulinum]EHN14243.1 N-acetylmuramoyl-L-alanine amidase [Clostridium sporogenes PA 3679]KOY66717.1 N-acetylmuramoyl-L-alanine amidase [Clostridium sporogenes]MBA4507322.1 N-acetylmuramoyl-L-alanine amidase CwlD [Clostridium sporogenes]MBW5458120.1 N-acetylmuramoyl-L-alanine amidase CwlD [Clostridium sporogenes]
MKIYNKKLVLATLIIFISLGFIIKINAFSSSNSIKEKKIILIDPGHGGMDGGAVAKDGTLEKDINLDISKILKKNLKKEGYKVVMTREDDSGLYSEDKGKRIRQKKIEDLNKRCEIKKTSECDMFISIHLNMFDQSKYYGAQVWYSNNEDSKKFAHILQNNLREQLDENNKRKEKAAKNSYKILRNNDEMPSVIVECGFLSNSMELDKLKSTDYQEKISKVIAKSVNDYFNDKE